MKKIIIRNTSDLDDLQALAFVSEVVSDGKISANGKAYCYMTTFGDITVYADVHKSGTNTFRVIKNK